MPQYGKRAFRALLFTAILLSGLFAKSVDAAETRNPGRINPPPAPLLRAAPDNTALGLDAVTGVLTLDQAIALALERNQELAGLALYAQAGREAATQAGLPPNPALDVAVENFGGSNDTSGFDGAETTVALSQAIELGGKRAKRRDVAMAEADGAAWAYKEKKVDLVADLKIAFNAVLADQQRLALAGEQLRLAEQVLATVQAKVEAGKVSRIEETKARTALATSRIALNNAQSALGASRNTLSAFWGGRAAAFEAATGEVAEWGAGLPDFEVMNDRALGHPRLARLTTEVARHEAALKLSRAERIPDVTVSAGVKRFEATDDNALVAGVSIPLGLFDRRQGAISQARHQWSAAKADLAAAKTDIRARLSQAYQTLSATQAEAQLLRDEALPGARAAFVATQEGYKQGKFGYLELLDAQKTFSELTRSHIDAVNACRNAFIELERVTGLDGADPIAEKP